MAIWLVSWLALHVDHGRARRVRPGSIKGRLKANPNSKKSGPDILRAWNKVILSCDYFEEPNGPQTPEHSRQCLASNKSLCKHSFSVLCKPTISSTKCSI